MKLRITKKSLLEAIELASRFVSRNSTLPILENIYISGNIDTLTLKATDMNKYIQISMSANIENEWALTVNARSLLDIIRTIDEDEILLEWKEDGSMLTVSTKSDKFDFVWISANEYIAIPDLNKEGTTQIDAQVLSKWIEKVEYAISEKSFTTVITWILFKLQDKKLHFVGTDSFRLAEYTIAVDTKDKFQLIVPKDAANEIKKVSDYFIANDGTTINIEYEKNLIWAKFKLDSMDIYIKSNLIQWVYPDYEKIIMSIHNSKLILDKTAFEKAVKKVTTFSKDINYFIKLIPDDDKLKITSGLTDIWEGSTVMDLILDGDSISLGVNGKHITDFIKNIEWEEIIMNIFDSEKPILLQDKSDDNYKYVIRPLKDEE